MLILFLEAILLVFIVRLLSSEWRSMVWRALFGIAMWLIFWLVLFQLELAGISPDGTYGSDARYYYEAMVSTLHAGKWWPLEGTLAPGYVAFGTLVLHTSPSESVVWVKLANIGLLLISLALGVYILQSWSVAKRVAYLAIVLAGTNGIVTWMAVRNLKDTMFLCFSLALIVGAKILLDKNRRTFVLIRILGILALGFVGAQTLELVRPWGLYWTTVIVGATIIEPVFKRGLHSQFRTPKLSLFAILALGLIVWFMIGRRSVIHDLFVAIAYAEGAGGLVGAGLRDIVLAVPRFLIGPGPIRAILGWEAFLVTTTMGNILIFLGAIMWWIYLPILILCFLRGPSYWLKYGCVLVPLLLFLAVYSFLYSGSLETRFRAIVYILSFLGTAPYLDMAMRRRGAGRSLAYVVIAALVWVGGTIASYISLIGQ